MEWERGREKRTYYYAILPNFDVVTDGSSFNDRPGPNVNVVPYLHRVIIKIPSIRLVGRPIAHPNRPQNVMDRPEGNGRHQYQTQVSFSFCCAACSRLTIPRPLSTANGPARGWSSGAEKPTKCWSRYAPLAREERNVPHDATLSNQTVPSQ